MNVYKIYALCVSWITYDCLHILIWPRKITTTEFTTSSFTLLRYLAKYDQCSVLNVPIMDDIQVLNNL